MATLMKATQPHWLGNKFVPVGTVLPEGHPEALEAFYEAFEVDEPETRDHLDARAAELGLKLDRRKSDDTVRAEIARAEAKAAAEAEEE